MPFWSRKKETPPPAVTPVIPPGAAALLSSVTPGEYMNPLTELARRFNYASNLRANDGVASACIFPPSSPQGYDRVIELRIRQWILQTERDKREALARAMRQKTPQNPVPKMQDNNIPRPPMKN